MAKNSLGLSNHVAIQLEAEKYFKSIFIGIIVLITETLQKISLDVVKRYHLHKVIDQQNYFFVTAT